MPRMSAVRRHNVVAHLEVREKRTCNPELQGHQKIVYCVKAGACCAGRSDHQMVWYGRLAMMSSLAQMLFEHPELKCTSEGVRLFCFVAWHSPKGRIIASRPYHTI